MIANHFHNYTLAELSKLRLIDSACYNLLENSGLKGLFDILEYYKKHQSFFSMHDCPQKSAEELMTFAKKCMNELNHEITPEELFSDSFNREQDFIVPVIINWSKINQTSRAFLDTWINYCVNWYAKPQIIPAGYSMVFESQLGWEKDPGYIARRKELVDFLISLFGKDIDAETFYEIAIVNPINGADKYPADHTISKSLFYLRSTFLKYYKATQVLTNPFDLFRFFAKNEFFISESHEIYQKITQHQAKYKQFPFAMAVYGIVSNSSFFNRKRRFQDINMERFVSIFNESPYGFGILNNLFGMSQAAFDKLKADSDAVAENGCHITIAVLKALGFKHYYPENPYKEDGQLNQVLITNINHMEKLYLPEGFYVLIFSVL